MFCHIAFYVSSQNRYLSSNERHTHPHDSYRLELDRKFKLQDFQQLRQGHIWMSTVCKSTYTIQLLKHSGWKYCSAMKRFTTERCLGSCSSPKIPLQAHLVSYFQQDSQSNSARTCNAVQLVVQTCSFPIPMVMRTFSDQHLQNKEMQQQHKPHILLPCTKKNTM